MISKCAEWNLIREGLTGMLLRLTLVENAMRAEWGVPGELIILPERRVPYLFRAQELVCCRRIKALDDEPDAQRKLKYEDRKCGQRSQGGILPDDTE